MNSENQILVSVCISVHNTSHLLPRCLDSVVNQTLQSLEIVLVNNGSTDNSEEIMHQYESKYTDRRFVIIRQEDRGLAQGRATGVNNASGEYIAFLDADDYVTPDAYEKMYNAAKENKVEIVEARTKKGTEVMGANKTGVHSTHDVLRSYLYGDADNYTPLWLRIYKRTLFTKPVFPKMYVNNEDHFAWPCLLHAANKIFYMKEQVHYYTIDNPQGVMYRMINDPSYAKKYYNSQLLVQKCIHHIQDYLGEEAIRVEYSPMFGQFICNNLLRFLQTEFPGVSYKQKKKDLETTLPLLAKISISRYIKENTIRPKMRIIIRLFGLKGYLAIIKVIRKYKLM